jgi:hypothetical protein
VFVEGLGQRVRQQSPTVVSAFGVADQDFLPLEVDVFQAELETLQ